MPRRAQRPPSSANPTSQHTSSNPLTALADERRRVLGKGLSAWLSAGDAANSRAAFWASAKSEPGFVRVWNAKGGQPVDVDVSSGRADGVTAVSAGFSVSTSTASDGSKKQKRKSQSLVSRGLFGIGTASGRVFLFDPAAGQLVASFSASSNPILAVSVTEASLFLIDGSGNLSSYAMSAVLAGSKLGASDAMDVDAPEPTSSVSLPSLLGTSSGSTQFRAASISPNNGNLLISLDARLLLLDAKFSVLKIFKGGHAESIVGVSVGSSNGKDVAVTIGEDELGGNIWSLDDSEEAIASINLASQPLQPVFLPSHILIPTVSGSLHIFDLDSASPSKKKSARRLTESGVVSFVSSEESEDVLPILSLAYHADGSVEFARGSLLKPTFETVPAETVADLLAAGTSKLVRPGESVRSLLVAETAGPATKKRKDENEVIVLRGSESGEPGVGAVVFEEEDLELPTHMPKSSELPLSQRLASINLATPQPAPKPAKVPATTLLSLLTQALRTSDPTLLESCLTTTHLATIKQTVAKLGTPWILPLLGALESRIRAKPVRTRQLLPWLKTLLVTHTGYLTSHPSIPPRLAALESLLRARLGAVEKMYGLLGRLEVALSSVERRGLEEDGEEGMAVYREEEEEWEGGVGEGEEEEEEGFLEAAESDSEAGNESDSESGEEISDDEDGDEDEDEELEGFSDEDGSDDDDEEEED